MEEFNEIAGAILEDFSTSSATYVGMNLGSEPLEIEGASLTFDRGILVIENPFVITDSKGASIHVENLKGDTVRYAFSTDLEITIKFKSGSRLSISMNADDFKGPEAASWNPNEGPIIVFN